MKALLVSILLIAASGCASNQTSEQITKMEHGENAKKSVGYECKKVYALGSNIPKRVCNTREQRKRANEASKDIARDYIKRSSAVPRQINSKSTIGN